MRDILIKIADKFRVVDAVNSFLPLGEGFINETFIVTLKNSPIRYILQKKNHAVFKDIPGMMQNIDKVTNHLKAKIIANGGNPEREAMSIIPTIEGNLYYKSPIGDFWTMSLYIEDHILHERADTTKLAMAGGKGIGMFQAMMSDFKDQLVDTLPGFHNIKFRFQQWEAIILKDPLQRRKAVKKELEWIESRRETMLNFWGLVQSGKIPKRITHNDTKISNILFDKKGHVLCVIDLDTVLNSTILNDFGDAIRSYTNMGREDDTNLENVAFDFDMFKAFSGGYLSEAKSFLTQIEIDNLAFSASYITFEQVLRFLMDYIDGDKYYKIAYPEHNLVRARAQFKLHENIEEQLSNMKDYIVSIAK